MIGRYDLTDFEWSVIQPLLPNKPRGVPRVDDRRVLSGIFWVLRSGAPWRDLPERYVPYTTTTASTAGAKAGVRDRLIASSLRRYRVRIPANIDPRGGQSRLKFALRWINLL